MKVTNWYIDHNSPSSMLADKSILLQTNWNLFCIPKLQNQNTVQLMVVHVHYIRNDKVSFSSRLFQLCFLFVTKTLYPPHFRHRFLNPKSKQIWKSQESQCMHHQIWMPQESKCMLSLSRRLKTLNPKHKSSIIDTDTRQVRE